jgi:hypothetical protein
MDEFGEGDVSRLLLLTDSVAAAPVRVNASA